MNEGYVVRSIDKDKATGVRHTGCMDKSVVRVMKPKLPMHENAKPHDQLWAPAPGIDLKTCGKCGKPVDLLLQ